MDINKISAVFFSPTDSTKTVLSVFCNKLPLTSNFINITSHKQKDQTYNFEADELVIFAVPVYSGRVPAPAIERILQMQGQQSPAVLIVNYGNREYEDALLELKNTVEAQGFSVLAAGAFISEHSIMHSVAKSRPDQTDCKLIEDFADKVWQRLQKNEHIAKLELPGNYPYREYKGVPLKAKATRKCTKCGACAEACPVNAIPAEDPKMTKKEVCISCMRCLKICPAKARKVNPIMLYIAERAFYKKYSKRKESEVFLS